MMNPVVHFEMPYKDAERVKGFYQSVFGWKTEQMGPEMGNYIVVTTAGPGTRTGAPAEIPAGAINGGLFPLDPDSPNRYPSIVIAVDEIRASMVSISNHGGILHGEPVEIPGIGLYISFTDTEGNRCSILQPSM